MTCRVCAVRKTFTAAQATLAVDGRGSMIVYRSQLQVQDHYWLVESLLGLPLAAIDHV